MIINSCMNLKQVNLFDEKSDQVSKKSIENFYSLSIFSDNINGEHWWTESGNSTLTIPFFKNKKILNNDIDQSSSWIKKANVCLEIKSIENIFFSGSKCMHWKWNKNAGNCEWLGMGFGWDGWQGKDMSNIIDKAAIQLKVRSVNGILKSLPLAACLEDYSGTQLWIGFKPQTIESSIISEEWSNVILPIREFEWEIAPNFDPSNVKQFIVQFEAEGEIYVDQIEVIPYDGGFDNRIYINKVIDKSYISETNSWDKTDLINISNSTIQTIVDNNNFYFKVTSDKDIKSLEIAFSSDYKLPRKRKYMYSSDKHININFKNNIVENLKTNMLIDASINNQKKIYDVIIPFSEFNFENFKQNKVYKIEFGITEENTKKIWNLSNENFNNPSLWGEMVIK